MIAIENGIWSKVTKFGNFCLQIEKVINVQSQLGYFPQVEYG